MTRCQRIAGFWVGLASWPLWSWGWAGPGHELIATLAAQRLTPHAAQEITALLGPETLAGVSSWADAILAEEAWKHTEPWHYVNVDDGLAYGERPPSPRGDLVVALEQQETHLRDPQTPRAERAQALKFWVHFVGDAHQPLHAGRAADRGGNDLVVYWRGQVTNLHLVWDFHWIDWADLTVHDLAQVLRERPAEIPAWEAAGPRIWIAESLALRAQVYQVDKPRLGRAFARRHLPLLQLRLAQAGVRLAARLNAIFADSQQGQPP